MEEFDEPIDFVPDFVCWDCDNELCINGMCDPMNWTDKDVIDEFICELNSDPDGILTLDIIFGWYWDEV